MISFALTIAIISLCVSMAAMAMVLIAVEKDNKELNRPPCSCLKDFDGHPI